MNWSKYFLILLLAILCNLSCKDACKDVLCANGTCVEGICECDEGYGGELCNERLSLKFVGEWSGNFNCENQEKDASIQISDDPTDVYALSMSTIGLTLSFDGLTFSLDEYSMNARINEYFTSIAIDTQKFVIDIPNNPGVSADLYGTGYLSNGNKLNLTINVENKDFGAYFTCSGVAEK